MSRIAYVNGSYVRHADAGVSIEDRGYQFADGVYEVCEVYQGALVDEPRHMARLAYSLGELRIEAPMAPKALLMVMREVVARNKVSYGYVYVQVTRGVAKRDHYFPAPAVRPAIVITAKAMNPKKGAANAAKGIAVISLPDIRWKRPDIKTIGLLPNVLARQAAREDGAYEAWLVDDKGFVSEGAATNAWIVDSAGTLISRQADQSILRGITRTTLLDLVARENLRFEERAFSLDEAYGATEAFITGATTLVMPVVQIDGRRIGAGTPGPMATRLRAAFHSVAAMDKS